MPSTPAAPPQELPRPQAAGTYRRLPDGSLEEIEPPTAPPAEHPATE